MMIRNAAAAFALAVICTANLAAQIKTKTQADMEAAATAATAKGCGTTVASHVYNPARLTVYSKCVTVTGTVVDATKGKRKDGVRREKDGDTHGWLRLDSEFKALLNGGNVKKEGGNLVFEVVCYWKPTQAVNGAR
jgi:L,D-peptidoglycan transpeptidase YkuD (ErfK/YbiS/YcfS/YnhG family)